MSTLTIGLDYDHTFTADPELWRQFIGDTQRRGHLVVCVTRRREPPDFSREPRLPGSVPIVYAGPTASSAMQRPVPTFTSTSGLTTCPA